jgi:hypothetical protein
VFNIIKVIYTKSPLQYFQWFWKLKEKFVKFYHPKRKKPVAVAYLQRKKKLKPIPVLPICTVIDTPSARKLTLNEKLTKTDEY